MKKRVLLLFLIVQSACTFGGNLIHGNEIGPDAIDPEVMTCVNQLGFTGILKKRLTPEVLRQLAVCDLEKICDFYSVDLSQVDAREYEEALSVIQRMTLQEMNSRLHIMDLSSPRKIRDVIQQVWSEMLSDSDIEMPGLFHLDDSYLLLRFLIKNEADIDKKHGELNATLLHLSVMLNKPLFVQLLLTAGVDPDAWIGEFATLHLAVSEGSLAMVSALLHAGACWDMEEDSDALLLKALEENNLILTSYLMAVGVRVSEQAQAEILARFPGLAYDRLLCEQREQIVRALSHYARENQRALADERADLIADFVVSHLEDKCGLVYSAAPSAPFAPEDMARINQLGFTGLVGKRITDTIMQQLAACYLENILSFYSIDSGTVDAIDYEVAIGVLKRLIYQALINDLHVADLSSTEKVRQAVQEYWDKIIAAVGFFDIFALDQPHRLVELLLKNGVDLEKKHGQNGVTLLHMAVQKKKLLIVEQLLAAGADPNAQTNEGATPLHHATKVRNLAIVQALCSAGSCWDITTVAGISIVKIAIDANDLILTSYLLAFGAGVGGDERTELPWKFLGFAYPEFLQEQRDKVIEELCHYAREHHLQLPLDIARLITSLVVSNFEERAD